MFEFVPFFHGYYLNYKEFLWLLTFTGMIALSLTSLVLSKIFLWFSNFKAIKGQAKRTYANLDFDPSLSTFTTISSDTTSLSEPPEKWDKDKHPQKNILLKISNYCSWLSWFFISYVPGVFSMYGFYVPLLLAMLLMLMILSMKLKMEERKDYDELETTNRWSNTSAATLANERIKLRSKYRRIFIVIVFLSIFVPSLWNKFCVNSFQEFSGIIFGTASLSSSLTRWFQLGEACPKGAACHIYATLPEDAATGVFINAHTHIMYDTLTFKYDTVEHYKSTGEMRHHKKSWNIEIEGVDSQGERRIHTGYLHGLEPETDYHIELYYNEEHLGSAKYRTFPNEHSKTQFIIANGGDNGVTWLQRNLTVASAQYQPDVIVSGGDVAYDNGMCTCYFAWDIFLVPFEELNRIRGRLIPLIFSVGNHDVGVDRMSERSVDTTAEGPFYMLYFPQHSRYVNGTLVHEVPHPHERKSYHYHKLGKMLILGLDSGLVVTYPGEQQHWLEKTLSNHKHMYKAATYHYPTYPVCPEYNVWDKGWEYRVELWNPLFDKYKFISIWENHEHMLKKTRRIKNGVPHDKGTYFIGNGGWGAYGDKKCTFRGDANVMESWALQEHYWIIKYIPADGTVVYSAYNMSNLEIIPSFNQSLKDYDFNDWQDYENDDNDDIDDSE